MKTKLEVVVLDVCNNNQKTRDFYLKDITGSSSKYLFENNFHKSPDSYIHYTADPINTENEHYSSTSNSLIFEIRLTPNDLQKFLDVFSKKFLSYRLSKPIDNQSLLSAANQICTILNFISIANEKTCDFTVLNSFEHYLDLYRFISLFPQNEIIPALLKQPKCWIDKIEFSSLILMADSYPDYADQITRIVFEHHPVISKISPSQPLEKITYSIGLNQVMDHLMQNPKLLLCNQLFESLGLAPMLIEKFPRYAAKIKHYILRDRVNFASVFDKWSFNSTKDDFKNIFPGDALFTLNSNEQLEIELKKSYGNIQKTLGFFREAQFSPDSKLNQLSLETAAKIAGFTNTSQYVTDEEAEQIAKNCM